MFTSFRQTDPEDCLKHIQIVEKLVNEHVLTHECLEHLARYVKRPSERMKLYEAQKWSRLSQLATSGILENSQKVRHFFKFRESLCSFGKTLEQRALIGVVSCSRTTGNAQFTSTLSLVVRSALRRVISYL